MGRRLGGGNGEGEMERGQLKGGELEGEKKGQEEGGILQMDMMECLGGYRL